MMKYIVFLILFFANEINAQIPNIIYDNAVDEFSIQSMKNGVYWVDTFYYSNGAYTYIVYDDLGNKTTFTTTEAPPKAELRLTKSNIPDTLGLGTNMTFLVEWSNSGTQIADNFITHIVGSADSIISTNDFDAGTTAFPNVFPAQHYTDIPTNVVIPDTIQDSVFYYLILRIDDLNTEIEYSDSNNIFIKKVFITACPTLPTDTPIIQANVCGLNNGRIMVEPSENFYVEWFDGSNRTTMDKLDGGTYTYTLINETNGCRYTDSATVEEFPTLQMNYAIANENCNQNDGSIQLTPNSGTAPYIYAWDNGDTTSSISNLQNGMYDVTIVDSAGCQNLYNLVVNETPTLEAQVATTSSNCEQNDGTAIVTANFGLAPYTYEWSTGDTTNQINNLSTGNYDLEITDNAGCILNKTFSVSGTSNPDLYLELQGISLVPISSTSSSNLAYFWSNGATTQSIDINLNQTASYWVEIINQSGCSATDTFHYTYKEPIDTTINNIDDVLSSNGFLVYPNPSKVDEPITLLIGDKEIDRLKVINSLGQTIIEKKIQGKNNKEIKLKANYSVGIYFVYAYQKNEPIGAPIKIIKN